VKEPFKLSVLAMGRREWNSSGRLKAGSGDVDAGGVACDATEPSEDRLGMSNRHVRMHCNTDFELYNCNFEESEHTTLRAVSPVHYGMSTIVHRSIAIAKTGRKHIQTHASGWHFSFSFCFATSFSFQANRSRARCSRKERIRRIEGMSGISSKNAVAALLQSFAEKRCEVWKHRSQTSPGTG